jgi:hypothetical protein
MMPTRIAGWVSTLAADKGERLSMRTAAKAERRDFMEARILQLDGAARQEHSHHPDAGSLLTTG